MNSVQAEITEGSVASEIKLSLSNPNVKHYFLVEGKDDIKFIKRSISNTIPISESPGGKEALLDIYKAISNNKLIAICDKDYTNNPADIVLYDYCALETMLFSIDKIMDDFFISIESNPDSALKEQILEIGAFIGTIRKYNSVYGLDINFKSLKPSNYYVEGNLEQTKRNVIDQLRIASKCSIDESKIEKIPTGYEEKLNLIQGHDLVKLLQYFFDCKSLGFDELQARLILASTPSFIRTTDFYERISLLVPDERLKE